MRQIGFLAVAAAVVLTLILLSHTTQPRRDAGDVEQALLGHWVAENGDDLYWDQNLVTAVTRTGTHSYHPWRVLMSNESEGWVRVLIANNAGENVVRLIRFNPDRKSYQTSLRLTDPDGRVLDQVVTVTYQGADRKP
ncbi:MAG: hypothetical protein AB7D57_12335 [Desulfovibrionaceae bacterium]